MQRSIGKLHVLTDFYFQQRYTHAELASMAIDGGADVIQFRQKGGHIRDLLFAAETVATVCARANICLLVNDRVDVAIAVGANGVHLGQTDMPIEYAREVLGPDAVIGITASTLALALQAEQAGADYIGFGPVFKTRSKDNPLPEKGLESVLEVCNSVQIPVIGIAGITPGRVPDLIRVGAHGVAVMSAVSLADDPRKATQQFVKAFESVSPRV